MPGSLQTIRLDKARLALACCAFLAVSACTKTSDGSIELDKVEFKQPEIPNLFKLRLPGMPASEPAPMRAAATQFPSRPAAPEPVVRSRPAPAKVRTQPRRAAATPTRPTVTNIPAAAAATEPAKPLACSNVTQSGGRIRVVCE